MQMYKCTNKHSLPLSSCDAPSLYLHVDITVVCPAVILIGTRKIGGEASCNIRRILRLPDYSVDSTGLSASALANAKGGGGK